MSAPKAPRQGILSLTIKDKAALYAAYMPFIRNGGLFIPTNKAYNLGDEVFMLLSLMEETERLRAEQAQGIGGEDLERGGRYGAASLGLHRDVDTCGLSPDQRKAALPLSPHSRRKSPP